MSFPPDDYTPYGYLDIPTHTRNLRPLGVVHSFVWPMIVWTAVEAARLLGTSAKQPS